MNRLKGISESSIKFEGGKEGTKQKKTIRNDFASKQTILHSLKD